MPGRPFSGDLQRPPFHAQGRGLRHLPGRTHRRRALAGDGKIYCTNLEGAISVVKAAPKFELLARNQVGETIVASPAVSNGQLFLRGEKHLYCIVKKGK
ncbi:MAG: hypothetical protein K2R98_29305 [Gemmataceae bacterium]|nr:hypothetical protein [Gemmataceae bacterium]